MFALQGVLELNNRQGGTERVVMKRVKGRVSGAQQIAEMEHVLNVYAASACPRSIAPFVGYLEVEESVGKLSEGLWLVWKYEGDRTLAYYLRRRDCIEALAKDLGLDDEKDVVPTVMKQIFECLVDLHSAGLVHRDVKPANLIFSSVDKRFKIIDLGAAVDLRTGTNYVPSETMLDPLYCPPEEYVLPTDSVHLAEQAAPLKFVMSPILWSRHRPECFDTYSAGVVLLQLGLPFLRSPSSLKNWKGTMIRLNHDVSEWRERARLSARQTAILDADDGLGWSLVEGLLRPREIQNDGAGGVTFVTSGTAPRLTASEALKHPFLKQLGTKKPNQSLMNNLFGNRQKKMQEEEDGDLPGVVPEQPESKQKAPSTIKTKQESRWSWIQSRIYDLEARIKSQASDTKTQTAVVKQLKADVEQGKASGKELEAAESKLVAMQDSLKSSVAELGSIFQSAKTFLGSSGSSSRGTDKEDSPMPSDTSNLTSEDEESSGSDVNQFLADAASSAIYSSLKFTGRALMAVADMAASAEQSLGEAQAQRELVRKEKAILIEVLNRLNVTENTTWSDAKANIMKLMDDSFLTETQMRRTFQSFVDDLARKKRVELKQAKMNFAELLDEANLPLNASYKSFESDYKGDPRFTALDNENRQLLFNTFADAKQKSTEIQRSTEKAIAPEKENKENLEQDIIDVESLRAEQDRLKSEYKEMQTKLKKMEKMLNMDNLLSSIIGEDFMSKDDDGSVTFRFAKGAPMPAQQNAEKKKKER